VFYWVSFTHLKPGCGQDFRWYFINPKCVILVKSFIKISMLCKELNNDATADTLIPQLAFINDNKAAHALIK